MSTQRDVIVERPASSFEGMRVSWGGVWAGVLVVLGTMLVLSTLGLAIGFSADAHSVDAEKIGTGAIIWSRISLLIALFLGGAAATRMSMVWDRPTALAQGTLVWVASLIVGLFLSANGIGLMASAALTYGLRSDGAHRLAAEPSAVAWITFIAVILSLLATLGGAALGRQRAAAHVTHKVE
jgi:hypothetical protein